MQSENRTAFFLFSDAMEYSQPFIPQKSEHTLLKD